MNNRKILAVDFGEKHVGPAVTDRDASMVFGKGEITGGKSLDLVFSEIGKVVKDEDVGLVVFGLPSRSDEVVSGQAERMEKIGRRLGDWLEKKGFGVKVVFQDESFSSFEARSMIGDIEVKDFKKKHSEHEIAAMIILKNFLKGGGRGKAE